MADLTLARTYFWLPGAGAGGTAALASGFFGHSPRLHGQQVFGRRSCSMGNRTTSFAEGTESLTTDRELLIRFPALETFLRDYEISEIGPTENNLVANSIEM